MCEENDLSEGKRRRFQIVHNTLETVPTLEDISLKSVHHKARALAESIEGLPPALLQKMDSFQTCICGDFAFHSSHAAAIR